MPELEMSDEDAARFTEAYREVRRHFPVPTIDPKYVALGTFAYVAYGIYAPRVAAVAAKKKGRGRPASSTAALNPMAQQTHDLTDAPVTADWFAGTA